MIGENCDFIVSELLSELKAESERKGVQIRGLQRALSITVCAAFTIVLFVIASFLWYLNQYDFTSTETIQAEGVYTIIDSDGNVISHDLTSEDIQQLMEIVINGEDD